MKLWVPRLCAAISDALFKRTHTGTSCHSAAVTGAGYTVSVGPLLQCVCQGQPLAARAVHVEAPWDDSQQGDAGRRLDDVIDGALRSPGEYPFALSDQHSVSLPPWHDTAAERATADHTCHDCAGQRGAGAVHTSSSTDGRVDGRKCAERATISVCGGGE